MFLSLRAYLSCFPGDSDCRVCLQCGRLRFDPCVGKIPSSRQPTPVFLLENPMDVGAWWATVHGVSKSGARLNDSHTHTHTHTSFLFYGKGLVYLCHRFLLLPFVHIWFCTLVNIHVFHIMHANSKAEWHTLDYEGHVSKNGTWERKKLLHIPPALNQQFHSLSSPPLMIWFFFHSNFRLLTSRTAQV